MFITMAPAAGEACSDPACTARISLLKGLSARAASSNFQEAPEGGTCPPDKDELGRAAWTLMHTVAAYYPEEPSALERFAAYAFFGGLVALYPCSHCREGYAADFEADPPRTDSREELSLWVCRQHNLVNERLGKSRFTCTMEHLDERWRTGRPECFGQGEDTAQQSLGQDELRD